MSEIVIKIENLKKMYQLGMIGGRTLNAELQSWWARKRGKEDPNLKLGHGYDHYGEHFYALKGINLEIKKGEAVGIIGGNGAGKSTLLKILSRITAPTEGDIWINGRISSMLEVGTGFHGELTGRENVYMNGAILGMSKKEIDKKMESIVEFSECEQFIDTPVKRYSSGMYVKLAFAVASHLDAEIMIMDEVLAVGDMKFQQKCLNRMGEEASSGKTILYVSHNMSTIRSFCTRCIVLQKGELIFDGDVENAISIYSESNRRDMRSSFDCSEMIRRDNLGVRCHITSFRFEKKGPIYEAGEEIGFTIEANISKTFQNVICRAVFYTLDGESIAMSETNAFILESGKKSMSIVFSTKNFPQGNYTMIISLNEISEFGEYEMLDEVPSSISFQITENSIYRSNKSRWIRTYWGSIRLDTMMIKIDNGGIIHE